MKYELWDIIDTGNGLQPFTKLFESDDFMEVFGLFEDNYWNNIVCVMIANKEPIPAEYYTGEKIYESPDGGKTIFERTMLNSERKHIND